MRRLGASTRNAKLALAALVAVIFAIAATTAVAAPKIVWAVGDGPNPYPDAQPALKKEVAFLAEQKAAGKFNDLLWLGDIYKAPDDKTFDELYGSTYGQFAKETYPTPGNHEAETHLPLKPYDDYWERERPAVRRRADSNSPAGFDNLYAANLGNGWRLLGLTSSFTPPDSSNQARNPRGAPPRSPRMSRLRRARFRNAHGHLLHRDHAPSAIQRLWPRRRPEHGP